MDWDRAMQYLKYDKGSTQKMVYRHQGWKGHQELMQQRTHMYVIYDYENSEIEEVWEDKDTAVKRAFVLNFNRVFNYADTDKLAEVMEMVHLSGTPNFVDSMRQTFCQTPRIRDAVYAAFGYDGGHFYVEKIPFFHKHKDPEAA